MKKAQASVATESEAAFPTLGVDDFPGDEAQSSTSLKEDEDNTPPVSSILLHDASPSATAGAAESLSKGFGGARPRIPASVMGSSHHKKALPHCSTHA